MDRTSSNTLMKTASPRHHHAWTCCVVLIAWSNTSTASEVEPPDVYMEVSAVRSELELIRQRLGNPVADERLIEVIGVAPREAYFAAGAMFSKAERLAFEFSYESLPSPPEPGGDIYPADVRRVVVATRERLLRIKSELGITQGITPERRDPTKSPTDVLVAILAINRQLNSMLDSPFAPSDVYEQVTHAISYAARIRASRPGGRMPATPVFEAGKTPADVYRQLLGCLEKIREIAAAKDLTLAQTRFVSETYSAVTPSDVFDIASLLVGEMRTIHGEYPEAKPPHPMYYPGDLTPSHVLQRARLLDAMLAELVEELSGNADRVSTESP